ncbi:hypothetical protein D3C87_1659510 [compost metagenome]
MVPKKSKMPITASVPAAVTAAIPKSPQMEIQCVWIRPLVESPQTKNVPKSTQKTGFPDTLFNVSIGDASVARNLWSCFGGFTTTVSP